MFGAIFQDACFLLHIRQKAAGPAGLSTAADHARQVGSTERPMRLAARLLLLSLRCAALPAAERAVATFCALLPMFLEPSTPTSRYACSQQQFYKRLVIADSVVLST